MSKLQTRFKDLGTVHNRARADVSLIDDTKRMIPFIIVSRDNAGLRYDWWEDEIYEERLDVMGATFDKLRTFFKDHRLSVDTAIGKIENTRIENGEVKCDVVFGSDTESDTVYRKFKEGILSDVSIGYSIQEVVETKREKQPTEVLVTRFDILELSAVWKGFDKNATIGRSKENLIEEVTHNEETESKSILKEKRKREIDLLEMA